MQYDLHPVAGNPDSFVLIEKWASKATLEAHHRTAHMEEAGRHNPTFRAGPSTVLLLVSTGNECGGVTDRARKCKKVR